MPTILELFKGSEKDTSVKADKETLVEQETTGIRFRSAVDVNNPLIYGNEAIRITQRSTPLLEDMKEGANGGKAGGGLIGGAINKARDFVNSTIGIPETQTPTRVVDKIDGEIVGDRKGTQGSKLPSSTPITKDIVGKNGTEFGKLLKQSGGGDPKTLGKQALGAGIGLVKDKLREGLFGSGQTIGEVTGEKIQTEYNNTNTYTDVLSDPDLRNYTQEGGSVDEFIGIDLSLVSPVYGVQRQDGRFGKSDYKYEYNSVKPKKNESLPKYSPLYNKSNSAMRDNLPKLDSELIGMRTKGGDSINSLTTSNYDTIDETTGTYKKGETEIAKDLIPFYIGKYGEKKTPFRAILTGITENVSPSWNTSKFLGNPFPYYTYTQIERSTSFNLKIVCYRPTELATNWEKIEQLTKMTYPKINSNNLVNPPIIDFRLGDIYFNKIGFIETLTYTIPDNSTWETNGSLGFLPKFIEVAISIKFIEDKTVLSNLYGYKKSKAAIDRIKEETLPTTPQGVSITGNTTSIVGSGDVPNKMSNKVTVTSRGVVPVGDDGIQTTGMSTTTKQNKVKSTEPKGIAKTQTPIQADSGNGSLDIIQSAISDKLEGQTPIDYQSKAENELGLTPQQARVFVDYKSWNDTVDKISLMQLPEGNEYIDPIQQTTGEPNSVYIQSTLNGHSTYWEITTDGRQMWLWEDEEPRTSSFGGSRFAPGYNRNQIKG